MESRFENTLDMIYERVLGLKAPKRTVVSQDINKRWYEKRKGSAMTNANGMNMTLADSRGNRFKEYFNNKYYGKMYAMYQALKTAKGGVEVVDGDIDTYDILNDKKISREAFKQVILRIVKALAVPYAKSSFNNKAGGSTLRADVKRYRLSKGDSSKVDISGESKPVTPQTALNDIATRCFSEHSKDFGQYMQQFLYQVIAYCMFNRGAEWMSGEETEFNSMVKKMFDISGITKNKTSQGDFLDDKSKRKQYEGYLKEIEDIKEKAKAKKIEVEQGSEKIHNIMLKMDDLIASAMPELQDKIQKAVGQNIDKIRR